MKTDEVVYYEWALEDLDEHDDIADVNHTTDTNHTE